MNPESLKGLGACGGRGSCLHLLLVCEGGFVGKMLPLGTPED